MIKFPSKTRTAWLEALRSGKYKQDHRRLKSNDGFCCLGVLCDVMGTKWQAFTDQDGIITFKTENGNNAIPSPVDVGKDVYNALHAVVVYDTNNPRASVNLRDALISMNDQDGKTFNEIADFIDENTIPV